MIGHYLSNNNEMCYGIPKSTTFHQGLIWLPDAANTRPLSNHVISEQSLQSDYYPISQGLGSTTDLTVHSVGSKRLTAINLSKKREERLTASRAVGTEASEVNCFSWQLRTETDAEPALSQPCHLRTGLRWFCPVFLRDHGVPTGTPE